MSVRNLPSLYLKIQVMDDSVKVLFLSCLDFPQSQAQRSTCPVLS
jgi:hypothetical protein